MSLYTTGISGFIVVYNSKHECEENDHCCDYRTSMFCWVDSVDMILMLLTLKNRKQKGRAPLSPLASRPSDGFCTEHKNLVRGSLNRYGPQEVQRFIETGSDFNSDLLRLAAT